MLDPWTELGRLPLTRVVFKRIGLSSPPRLLRASRPWTEDLLYGKRILLNPEGPHSELLKRALGSQKALVSFARESENAANTSMAGKEAVPRIAAYQGTVFDATNLQTIAELERLFNFFQPHMRRLGWGHRMVVLFREWPEGAAPEARATARAIEGFVRSLAKELGSKGTTLNAVQLPDHPEAATRLLPLVSFLLSDHCSFVTAQILRLSTAASGPPEMPTLAGSLAGKRALVTGAAQGIGYAICRRLADEGVHVLGVDRPQNRESLRELARHIDGEAIESDLGVEADLTSLIERLQNQPAPLDILVHNAGITRDRSLFAMQKSQWDSVLQINLGAPVRLSHELLHRGLLAEGGRVICLSSIVALAGNYGQTNYATAKAGLIGFIEGLAPHLNRQGITCNAVAPGFIETQMTAQIPFVAKQLARRMATLGQGGLPDDVAETVCFLASPASQGLNAIVLRVCGGHLMGS